MTIILVRHPATPWTGVRYLGRNDLGWSRSGAHQAVELVADLRLRIDAQARIVTSPLRRAQALAEQLARSTGGRYEIDERWAEVDVGRYEGSTFAEIAARDAAFATELARGNLEVDWPEGERGAAFRGRVASALGDLPLGDGTTVVVTHGGPIGFVLQELLGGAATRRFLGAGAGIVLTKSASAAWCARPLRSTTL